MNKRTHTDAKKKIRDAWKIICEWINHRCCCVDWMIEIIQSCIWIGTQKKVAHYSSHFISVWPCLRLYMWITIWIVTKIIITSDSELSYKQRKLKKHSFLCLKASFSCYESQTCFLRIKICVKTCLLALRSDHFRIHLAHLELKKFLSQIEQRFLCLLKLFD